MDRQIIAAVVVCRHGARFPNTIMPGDLSFPATTKFWDTYSAMLTPTGVYQMYNLGAQMAKRYGHLTENLTLPEVSEKILAYTSNTSRTIFTAMAVLDGFLPQFPKYFSFHGDRSMSTYNLAEDLLNRSCRTLGVRINIEQVPNTDTLFHLGKGAPGLKEWRKNNINNSSELRHYLDDPRYLALTDKLYRMTENPDLDPNLNQRKRILGLKQYSTILRYADCHHTMLMPNVHNLSLNQLERDMIMDIANVIYSLQFRPYNNLIIEEKGSQCAGFITSEIVRYFTDIVGGKLSPGLRLFSAHDTTLLAMSAALGLRVDSPNFGSYYTFELYNDYTVEIRYNPEPDLIDMNELIPRYWRKEKYFNVWNDLPCGNHTLSEFTRLASFQEYLRVNQIIEYLANTRKKYNCQSCKGISPDDVDMNPSIKEKYLQVFSYYDTDGSGELTPEEFILLFRRFDENIISDQEIREIIQGFSNNNRIGAGEFLCIVKFLTELGV